MSRETLPYTHSGGAQLQHSACRDSFIDTCSVRCSTCCKTVWEWPVVYSCSTKPCWALFVIS